MANFEASQWARRLRDHDRPLIVAGDGCDQIELDGKPLSEYARELAKRLDCPVAATGNTVVALQEEDKGVKLKKMWLAELFRYLEEKWEDPIMEDRPDLLLLLGYQPHRLSGMVAGIRDIGVVHLGPGELPEADLTMGAIPLREWKQNLDALLKELG